MSSLPTSPIPAQSSTKTVNYRVTRVSFGNGYEQRSVDGLNGKRDSWRLVYENLNLTDLATLTSFFDGLGGATYFTWIPIGESVSKNWITNGDYTVTIATGNLHTLSVPIQQVYDL